ncbi:hypothetical protein CSE_00670 [Caldisericum exile AZM16c01]|uniref:Uncharacterized protein n=1 Tax=Caldisericum exile (strain DSM 21853 / NBRC 104410 / AZM16c01) TaxID=511051 RepID=A0A7U6JE88_CALEA|nr:hypothetical protein CSE_00670 [Caldisericum exile AZM16c01]
MIVLNHLTGEGTIFFNMCLNLFLCNLCSSSAGSKLNLRFVKEKYEEYFENRSD